MTESRDNIPAFLFYDVIDFPRGLYRGLPGMYAVVDAKDRLTLSLYTFRSGK